MESTNNFTSGLNSDRTQLIDTKDTYVEALNCDIILDEINGSFVLTNSKGNKLQASIPNTYKLHSWATLTTGSTSISMIGFSLFTWTPTAVSTNKSLYDALKVKYQTLITNKSISLSYNESNVVLMELVPNLGLLITSNTALTINTNRELQPRSQHYPIGYGVINKDIYIITTTSTNVDPKSSNDGYGYFWRFNYDDETFDTSSAIFTLIYAANLNMSTYWHYTPKSIVTRYETEVIQKMWFTDFYNPLRNINVVDPQLMAEDPSILSFNPRIDMYKPILTKMIDGGPATLNDGMYQAAYRLTKNNGTSTTYSEFSNFAAVTFFPMNSSYTAYVSGGGDSSKILTWKVDNIDVDFDFIELIIISKTDTTNINAYAIKLVATEPINNRTSISFDVDGGTISAGTTVLISEIVSSNINSFTHCRTIAEKDNMLIAANLKNDSFSLPSTFDARAFRAFLPSPTPSIKLTNNGIDQTYTLTSAIALDRESDAINDYTDDNKKCFYKPGTDRLGGAGQNISYEFYTIAIPADKNPTISPAYAPFFETGQDSSTGYVDLGIKSPINNQTYSLGLGNSNGFIQGWKNPTNAGTVKGYVRGEIYRFAIEVFTKEKIPMFTEWIGDIKFPDYFDRNDNALYLDGSTFPSLLDFKPFSIEGGVGYTHSLGIKFTVTGLDNINNIGGYSIVRVERTSDDKTILFQGYLNSGETIDYDAINSNAVNGGSQVYAINNFSGVDRGFFHCPMIANGNRLIQQSNKVKLKYVADISALGAGSGLGGFSESAKYYTITDFFGASNLTPITNYLQTIRYAPILMTGNELAGQVNDSVTGSGYTIVNASKRSFGTTVLTANQLYNGDYGNPAYYLVLDTNITGLSATNLVVANIETINPNQYGGNTFNDRSGNLYISCGHFRPILDKANPIEEALIFGGDSFTCLYDSIFKRLNTLTTEGLKFSKLNVIPLESEINVDMMAGTRANTSFTLANLGNDLHESNTYSLFYSAEDNIRTYIPKPNPFTEVNNWNNRFAASAVKINGELSESWSNFAVADVWDADGDRGAINAILQHNSKMYFWQDKAFGIIQINPRVVIGDLDNPAVDAQVQLGFGQKLQRHDYISNISGTKHQDSVINTQSGLYWTDTNNKKISKLSSNKDGISVTNVSDLKGLYAYISRNFKHSYNSELIDKPCHTFSDGIKGITTAYDIKRNKIYFTFHNGDTSFTIVYNELVDSFITFQSFKPRMYIYDDKNVLTFSNEELYVHDQGEFGEYYGTKYKSTLKYIVNDEPKLTKIFDNLKLSVQSVKFINSVQVVQNQNCWNRMRFTNDSQNTDFQDLTYNVNLKRPEKTWKLDIPTNRVLYTTNDSPNIYTDLSPTRIPFGARMRDKYVQIELEYDNLDNNLLKTNSITTVMRESKR